MPPALMTGSQIAEQGTYTGYPTGVNACECVLIRVIVLNMALGTEMGSKEW